jgi:hypothetical protein
MHLAAVKSSTAVMQALLDAGGPVDAINRTLWTPLHHAARTGHPRVRGAWCSGIFSSLRHLSRNAA